MKRFNRLWALLLSFALMITYMPAMVFAEGDANVGADQSNEVAAESIDNTAPQEKEGDNNVLVVDEEAEKGKAAEPVTVQDTNADPEEKPESVKESAPAKKAPSEPTRGDDDEEGYTITIDYNGAVVDGETLEAVTVHVDEYDYCYLDNYMNFEVDDPHKVFSKWALDAEGNEPLDIDGGAFYPDEDTTVYAIWTDAYAITFNANGGKFNDGDNSSETKIVKTIVGKYVPWPDDPEFEGYVIAGWSTDPEGNSMIEDIWEFYPEGDLTIYAQWEKGCKVTLREEEDADEEHTHVVYVHKGNSAYFLNGSDYTFHRYPDEGYQYEYKTIGWSQTPGGDPINLETYKFYEDTVLYAIWGMTLDITYDPVEGHREDDWDVGQRWTGNFAEGDVIDDNSFSYVTIKGEKVRLYYDVDVEIDDDSMAFDRWYMDEDRTEELPADFRITADFCEEHNGELTLYAGYTDGAANITLNANGGVFAGSEDTTRTEKIPAGDATYLPGDNQVKWSGSGVKEVEGWYTDPACTIKADYVTYNDEWIFVADSDVTLYANWIDKEERLDYYYGGEYMQLNLGASTNIQEHAQLTMYEDSPEGETYDLYVTDVESADESIAIVRYEEDYDTWNCEAKGEGETTLTVSLATVDGSISRVVEVPVKVFRFPIWIGSPDGSPLVGVPSVLTAVFEEEDMPSGAEYVWTLGESEPEGCAELTPVGDGSEAELLFSEEGDAEVTLQLVKDGTVLAQEKEWFSGKETIYEIAVDGDDTSYLSEGESATLTFSLIKKTSDDPEGTVVEKASFDVNNDDSDEFQVVQESKNTFTFTKLTDEPTEIHIYAYDEGDYVMQRWLTLGSGYNEEAPISLNYPENRFFRDDERFELYVDDSDVKFDDYTIEYSVSKYDEALQDEDDPFVELDNTGNTLFHTTGDHGKTVVLNGPRIWQACGSEETSLRVTAKLVVNGKVLGTDPREFDIYDTEVDYHFQEDEELGLGQELNLYRYEAEKYDAAHPEGDWVDYYVTSAKTESGGADIIRIVPSEDEPGYIVEPVAVGEEVVILTLKGEEGDVVEHRFKVTVSSEIFSIGDVDIEGRYRLFPGESVDLKTYGDRYTKEDGYSDEGISYSWSLLGAADCAEFANEVTTDGKNTLTINDLDRETIEHYSTDGILLAAKVELLYNGEHTGKTSISDEIEVISHDDEICSDTDWDPYMRLNVPTKYDPYVMSYDMDYEDGPKKLDDLWYVFDHYEEDVRIVDAAGNNVVDGEFVQGPFTITRLSDEYSSISVAAYSGDTAYEDDLLDSTALRIDKIYNIKSATKVSGIADKTYTGKAITQSIKVLDTEFDDILTNGRDYKVAYKDNKNVGKATVTITGLGKYYGTITKTFNINPKPVKKISKLKAGKKSFTVTWKKQATQTTGYEIQYSLKKNFKKAKTYTVKKNKTTKATIKKLKGGKTYYVRIRTYKTVKGKKYRSAWSSAKKIKVKR